MNLLLDTHIFLWSLLEPSLLGPRTADLLADPGTTLWLSPVTTWECLMLAERGRIAVSPDAGAWMRRVLRTYPFREAPLQHEVALRSRQVGLSHQDPADRFLAATAAVYDLVLVTADARLLAGTGYQVRGNT